MFGSRSDFAVAVLAFVAALLSSACSGPSISLDNLEPETEDQAWVLLGTGEAEFEPMEGEPTVTLAAGSQGGFHVWASFLAYGFANERLRMVMKTSVVDLEPSNLTMRHDLTTKPVVDAEGRAARTFAGYPAQIDRARCAHGRRVRLELSLEDSDGHTATDIRYCIANIDERYRDDDCP